MREREKGITMVNASGRAPVGMGGPNDQKGGKG